MLQYLVNICIKINLETVTLICKGEFMKRIALVIINGVMACFFLSCASSPPANSLGEVETMFESPDVLIGLSSQQSEAMNQAGQAMVTGDLKSGAVAAGVGLAVTAAQEVANIPIRNRINEVAHEALLKKAKEQHGENIDIQRIRFTLIGQNDQTNLYQYTAKGFVVALNEEITNKIESDSIASTQFVATNNLTAQLPESSTPIDYDPPRINNDKNKKLRYPSHPANCCHNVIGRR